MFGGGRRFRTTRGQGRGYGGGQGLGPDGECVCPNCGKRVKHITAVPCYRVRCPRCGETMNR